MGEVKMAFDTGPGGRLNGFKFDPEEDVMIPGIDCQGPGHPMYQPETVDFWKRLQAGEFQAEVEDYVKRGQIVVGEVIKDKATGKAIPVHGRKRVLFLRVANKIRVERGLEPCKFSAILLERGTKQSEAMLRTISENTGRYKLNARELAEIAFQFLQLNGDTEEQRHDLCVSLRIDERRLDRVLALREASPKIHKAIDEGHLDFTAAIALAELPIAEQAQKLEELKAKAKAEGRKKVTTEDARAAKVGKHKKPPSRKIERTCVLLQAEGAEPGTLAILRFCCGLVGIEKTPEKFRNAYKAVMADEDKAKLNAMKNEAGNGGRLPRGAKKNKRK